jgi:hypothetical protein
MCDTVAEFITEAHYSRKDQILWTGYKVHLTETCDEHMPRLITNVKFGHKDCLRCEKRGK